MVDLNATQAAIRAGYSPRTAESQASRLLRNAKVKRAVEKAQTARSERTGVTQDRVLKEAARLAFSDIRECFDEDGKIKDTKDWPGEFAAAVSSTKSRRVNLDSADGHTDLVTELKLWDKPRNIELLMKHLGLLTEKVELKVEGDIVARLHEARKRVASGESR